MLLLALACSDRPAVVPPPLVPPGITALGRYGGQPIPIESFRQLGLAGEPTLPWVDVRPSVVAVHVGLDAPWLDAPVELVPHPEVIFGVQAPLQELRMDAGIRGETMGAVPIAIHPDTPAGRVAQVFRSIQAAGVTTAVVLVDPEGARPAAPTVQGVPFRQDTPCSTRIDAEASWQDVLDTLKPGCAAFDVSTPAPAPESWWSSQRLLPIALGEEVPAPDGEVAISDLRFGDGLNQMLIERRLHENASWLEFCGLVADEPVEWRVMVRLEEGRVREVAAPQARSKPLLACLTKGLEYGTYSADATGTFGFTLNHRPLR